MGVLQGAYYPLCDASLGSAATAHRLHITAAAQVRTAEGLTGSEPGLSTPASVRKRFASLLIPVEMLSQVRAGTSFGSRRSSLARALGTRETSSIIPARTGSPPGVAASCYQCGTRIAWNMECAIFARAAMARPASRRWNGSAPSAKSGPRRRDVVGADTMLDAGQVGKLKAKVLGGPKRLGAQQCESLSRLLVA
jgi:hypothetical protein